MSLVSKLVPVRESWSKLDPKVRSAIIIVLAIALALGIGFVWGRQSKPAEIKTVVQTQTVVQEKIVEVEKKSEQKKEDTDKQQQIHRTVVVVKKPDGTVTTTKTEDIGTKTDTETSTAKTDTETSTAQVDEKSESKSETTVTNYRPQWRVGLDLGLQFSGANFGGPIGGLPWIVGAGVDRQILGPVWVGAWAQSTTNRLQLSGGIRLSMEF